MLGTVVFGDAVDVLRKLSDGSVNLIYIDPPFNTGKRRILRSMKNNADDEGDRVGFGGKKYSSRIIGEKSYSDSFEDYIAFLRPCIVESLRVLTDTGSLYLHIDYRESHRCRFLLDEIFGEENFRNEIIWAYDFGGRGKRQWPCKHDTILFYAKSAELCYFDLDAVERIPYMAPELAGPVKAAMGKSPTDVWWHTIVSPTGHEKTGYPTQKPIGVLKRIVSASSRPGDLVLDFFAGSGTTGAAALELGRRCLLVDSNRDAIETMRRRLSGIDVNFQAGEDFSQDSIAVSATSVSGLPVGDA